MYNKIQSRNLKSKLKNFANDSLDSIIIDHHLSM